MQDKELRKEKENGNSDAGCKHLNETAETNKIKKKKKKRDMDQEDGVALNDEMVEKVKKEKKKKKKLENGTSESSIDAGEDVKNEKHKKKRKLENGGVGNTLVDYESSDSEPKIEKKRKIEVKKEGPNGTQTFEVEVPLRKRLRSASLSEDIDDPVAAKGKFSNFAISDKTVYKLEGRSFTIEYIGGFIVHRYNLGP